MQASLPYRHGFREFYRGGHWIHAVESLDQDQDADNPALMGELASLLSLIATGSHRSPTGFVRPYE